MAGLGEHPEIEWAMRTGYPSWQQPDGTLYCPACERELEPEETVYVDRYGDVIGCEYRLSARSAEDDLEE